jgi:hypothetical protein
VTFGEVIAAGLAALGVVDGRVMRFPHRFCTVTRTRPTGYASGLTLTQKRSHFLQRPLCKVVSKLSTELGALAGYKLSYPQADVDNCGQNPVDNPQRAFPPAVGGGVGAGGEGSRSRYPLRHFLIFCFLIFDLTLPPCRSTKTP